MLQAMQEKNAQLEKSLSSETKLKMDLFSALGDAKRELSIASGKTFNSHFEKLREDTLRHLEDTWAEIHQALLSQFSLLTEFFIVKVTVKD